MSNAKRDSNRVTTLLGVSSIDLTTPTLVAVNPSTGAVLIDGTSLYTTLDDRYLDGGAKLMVAASNAPTTIKNRADYVCDGTADDVQIQAALDAGSSVELSKGDFTLAASLVMSTDDKIEGQGTATNITLATNVNDHVIKTAGTDLVYFVTLKHFRITGNKANQSTTGHKGIYMNMAHSWSLEDVHIKETKDNGIQINGDATHIALNNRLFKCRIEDTGTQGLFINAYAPNNHFVGNIVGGTDDWYGIECANDENIFEDNHIHSTANTGILVSGTNNLFSGNIVESSGNHGWDITGNHNRFVNCVGFNNTNDGFNVASDYNSFTNCRAFDRQGVKTQDYGFDIQSGADNNTFVSCVALTSDHTTGGIRDSGANNQFLSNENYTSNHMTGGLSLTKQLLIDGSSDEIQLLVQGNGTQTSSLAVFENSSGTDQITFSNTGGAVFNEQGNDADFRIEGDTNVNLLFLDASADKIGIGTNAPVEMLHVLAGSGDRTIILAEAPLSSPEEATITTKLNYGSGNSEFIDWTIEDYAGVDHKASINIAKSGTGSLLPFIIRYWDQDLGTVAAAGKTYFTITPSVEVVINDDSQDVNFRIESDGDANIFFVDAGLNRVGIGTNAPSEVLHIYQASGYTTMRFDAGVDQGFFYADNDFHFVVLGSRSATPFRLVYNQNQRLDLSATENVFNDNAADIDTRMEGDTNANLFFLDASTDRIGIGTNSPGKLFHVAGGVEIDDEIFINFSTPRISLYNASARTLSIENGGGGTANLNVDGYIQCNSISNDTGLAAGVYTPTRSAEANMDSNVTMTEAQYMRVGNTVTVSGRFTADPTTPATTTSFEITLPVASNIGAAEDVAGVAFCGNIAGQGAEIIGVAANDTAKIQWKAGDVTSQTWSFILNYQVL